MSENSVTISKTGSSAAVTSTESVAKVEDLSRPADLSAKSSASTSVSVIATPSSISVTPVFVSTGASMPVSAVSSATIRKVVTSSSKAEAEGSLSITPASKEEGSKSGTEGSAKLEMSNTKPKVELPRATTTPVVSLISSLSSASTTASSASPAVVLSTTGTSQHIRIPTVPTNLRAVSLSSSPLSSASSTSRAIPLVTSPRTTASISIAKPAANEPAIGHHKLPMTPIITSIPTNLSTQGLRQGSATSSSLKSPQGVTVIQQTAQPQQSSSEPTRVTVVHAPTSATAEGTSKSPGPVTITTQASIRPLQTFSGFPVTIRSQAPGKPGQIVSNSPIQLVPLSSSGQINRAAVAAGSVASIRQLTAVASKPAQGLRATDNTVRVTLVQTPSTITKVQTTQPLSGAQQANYFKPVTLTAHAGARTVRPQATAQIATSQPLRLAAPVSSRMTVVPNPSGLVSSNVSLSQTQISVPIVSQQQGQPMARILTPSRLITVPSAHSSTSAVGIPQSTGGVTIQKTVVSTTAKTITLPSGSTAVGTPKTIAGSAGIPVARVFPQSMNSSSGENNMGLLITRTVGPQMHFSTDSSLIVTSVTSSEGALTLTKPNQPSSVSSTSGLVISRSPMKQQNTYSNTDVTASPSRPGILRRREGERELIIESFGVSGSNTSSTLARPESRDGAASSSGSTTLSATSSPCDTAQLSGEENAAQVYPSPRKKPRKQQHSNVREPHWSEPEDASHSVPQMPRRKSATSSAPKETALTSSYLKGKPQMSLLTSYRHTWKSRHNHFLRYSDVRPKEEKKPTINEIANQNHVMQKVNGWKLYHLSTQIEDITDIEVELSKKLSTLQKKVEKMVNRELSKDVATIQEIIKANLQRSKVIQDQVSESKTNSLQLFEHKSKVQEILTRYVNKRPQRKRELKT